MSKLATEYHGFLKFIKRANQEVVSWFGPICNYDPSSIALMAAREWESMSDNERKYFIKSNKIDSHQGEQRGPSGTHPFLCFLLHKRHSNFLKSSSGRETNSSILNQSLFHPQFVRNNRRDWFSMSDTEREKYANMKLPDVSIGHVIENRERLHKLYDPKDLSILEFILKTRPKKPMSSRTWFFTMESLRVNSVEGKERWCNLSQEDRRFYEECTRLDKKRFQFEKNAWITKLLSIDFARDDLMLSDFESMRAQSSIETIGGLIAQNKSLIPENNKPKRPLGPFSLFVRDYRYQIRADKPEFRFGQHLKETSQAWAKLTDDERQLYKDISKELKEEAKDTTASVKPTSEREVCELLFKHEKSATGPSRPSHLVARVPSVVDVYGKAMNIRKQDRKNSWSLLSDETKKPYIRRHQELRAAKEMKKAQIKAKLAYIDELISRSEELERLKKGLHLLRAKNSAVKDIYD